MRLIGVDLPGATPRRRYRDLLDWIERNQQIRGMVITSHKIDLFRAGFSRFAAADRLSATLGEISALRRTPSGDLLAYATDPPSSRAAAAELDLGTSGGETICFGAGGAAVALMAALTLPQTELSRERARRGRRGRRPGQHRRPGLLPARRPPASVLPAARVPPPQG
jgi:shikimate 5-dehydrogenase